MITGNTSTAVTLKKSVVAIQRAQGMDVKTLSSHYNLSTGQMAQALIDMGYAKPRAGSKVVIKPKSERDQKFEDTCTRFNFTAETLQEILASMGVKVKGKIAGRKYTIIDDIKADITKQTPDAEPTSPEPQA
jgi:hypothetical protein